jgi:hypothetical protein
MPNDFYGLPDARVEADEVKPGTRDYQTLEWCESRLQEGRRFVEAAVGFDKIDNALNSIFSYERESGASYVPTPKPLSRTRANLCAKTAEDLTADLTDTRIFWNYATRNPKYESQARICNKEAEDWYTSRNIDLRLADLVRYYTIAGTGWGHLYYNRRLEDMMLEALDPRNVFPIEPISYHSIQDALGVILRQPRTPHWVQAEYGKDVKPDIGSAGMFGWFTRTFGGTSKNKHSGPLSKSRGDDQPIPATPTVFVNTMYLNDTRTNESNKTQYMGPWKDGEPTAPWSYQVPPGAPLYPFKRLIVWGGNCLLYDDTSPYWHAQFPLLKLTLNPWPMSWLGKAPLWDVMPLNESLNSLLRVIDDHAAKLAQPGVVADRNVSRAELNKFNSRTPGYQIRTNMAAGKGIQIQVEPPLQQSLWQHVNWIETMIQKLSGTADMTQVSQLGQLPSDDTLDTLMKMMTPGNRLRSRILEGFMKDFAEQYLYCIAEFDTISKRVAKFGPQAVTPEDFDYDPGTFIPDDVPDGTPGDIGATEDALAADNPRPQYMRARQMFDSFTFTFKPGSLLNSAAMQERMEDLMLSKMGYLSVFTLMENLGKMNFAPPSLQVPNDELSRLQLQAQLGIGMIANAQGRKATDEAPPKLSNDGAGDVTLKTS